MAWIYFALFVMAVGLGTSRHTFRFPPAGPGCWERHLRDLLLALVAAAFVVACTRIGIRFVRGFREMVQLFRDLLNPLDRRDVFMISAFSSVGEEFFFRGWLQAEIGLVGASVLFGLLHVGPGRKFIPWTIFALVLGFGLGGLYEWRGNLLVPVVVHFAVNYVNLGKWGQSP
jgi:uncharacterized protein